MIGKCLEGTELVQGAREWAATTDSLHKNSTYTEYVTDGTLDVCFGWLEHVMVKDRMAVSPSLRNILQSKANRSAERKAKVEKFLENFHLETSAFLARPIDHPNRIEAIFVIPIADLHAFDPIRQIGNENGYMENRLRKSPSGSIFLSEPVLEFDYDLSSQKPIQYAQQVNLLGSPLRAASRIEPMNQPVQLPQPRRPID